MNKCHICAADAAFVCRQCGKPACGDHFSFYNGKCAECNGGIAKQKAPAAPIAAPIANKVTKRQKARK